MTIKFLYHFYLVGGFTNLEKYDFVNGKDDIPYMKWKIIQMFETINHIYIYIHILYIYYIHILYTYILYTYLISYILVLFENFSWLGPGVPGRGVVVVAHGDVHRQAFICVLAGNSYMFNMGLTMKNGDLLGCIGIYPLVMSNIAIENGHRNSGFSQLENGWIFHCYVNVYQRVISTSIHGEIVGYIYIHNIVIYYTLW